MKHNPQSIAVNKMLARLGRDISIARRKRVVCTQVVPGSDAVKVGDLVFEKEGDRQFRDVGMTESDIDYYGPAFDHAEMQKARRITGTTRCL